MTLTEFLLARIAEDEAWGRRVHAERCETPAEVVSDSMGRPMEPVCDCDWRIPRVLAECEAKRRIVETCGLIADDPTLPSTHLARHVLADLALLYADHPDYPQEWRP